jgi:hypothetical protein
MRAVFIKPDRNVFKIKSIGVYALKSMRIYNIEKINLKGKLIYRINPDTDSMLPEEGIFEVIAIYEPTHFSISKGDSVFIDLDPDFLERDFRIVEDDKDDKA